MTDKVSFGQEDLHMTNWVRERTPCIFCGSVDRKLTKEHIFGQWMKAAFDGVIGEVGSTEIRSSEEKPSHMKVLHLKTPSVACATSATTSGCLTLRRWYSPR